MAELIVDADDVAVRLGIDPATVTDLLRAQIAAAVEDAQSDVELALLRPLIPTAVSHTAQRRRYGQDVLDAKSWPVLDYVDDAVKVLTAEPNDDDPSAYDIQVHIGIDGADERPIVRYIRAAAVEALRANPGFVAAARRVSSVSADGQSVSYEKTPVGGEVGAPPTLDQLARSYKRRILHQDRTPPAPAWPFARAYPNRGW